MALLKTFLSVSGQQISDDCVQIFGGRGITVGGMGALINQHQSSYKFDSILGGSEEVLGKLSTPSCELNGLTESLSMLQRIWE